MAKPIILALAHRAAGVLQVMTIWDHLQFKRRLQLNEILKGKKGDISAVLLQPAGVTLKRP